MSLPSVHPLLVTSRSRAKEVAKDSLHYLVFSCVSDHMVRRSVFISSQDFVQMKMKQLVLL